MRGTFKWVRQPKVLKSLTGIPRWLFDNLSICRFYDSLDTSISLMMTSDLRFCYIALTLPNIRGGTMYPPNRRSSIASRWKCFWWHTFFIFHIHVFYAFWPNFMTVSFQLSKLWPFLKGGADKTMIWWSKHCTSGK